MWRLMWGGAFVVQSALLFWRLDLLPIWGDEQFTLDVIALPWSEIPRALQRDIHPPLYYLLAKAWVQLVPAGSEIVRLRALSAVAVLATVPVLAAATRSGDENRLLPLMWAAAPALALYGRIGRSYSLQMLVSVALILVALRFLKDPGSRKKLAAYCALSALLLYIHYLPGVAIPAAASIIYLWRRVRPLTPLLVSWAVTALVYLPWMATLFEGMGRVAESTPYRVTSSGADHVLRLGYLFASFNFGEALPEWGVAVAVIVGGGLLWVYAASARPLWFGLVALAAVIAYLGAGRWVHFAFTPGRLLFLLPFWLWFAAAALRARGRIGEFLLGATLLIQATGLHAYFNRQGFLNKAYVIPFDEMAQRITAVAEIAGALVVVDHFSVDPKPLTAALRGKAAVRRYAPSDPPPTISELAGIDSVWVARGTNDRSPNRSLSALEDALRRDRDCRRFDYVPYSRWERAALSRLGRPSRYHYSLLRCDAR